MSILDAIEPGDLILVQTTSLMVRFGAWATGNPYDHIAVAIGNGEVMNIDQPVARRLPVSRVARSEHRPLVFRPRWRSPEARNAFVDWMTSLDEQPYDTKRTLRLIPRILVRRLLRVTYPHEELGWKRERWICTDAVFLGLEKWGDGFEVIRKMPLDWTRLRCASTNDFLYIRKNAPALLEPVGSLND